MSIENKITVAATIVYLGGTGQNVKEDASRVIKKLTTKCSKTIPTIAVTNMQSDRN